MSGRDAAAVVPDTPRRGHHRLALSVVAPVLGRRLPVRGPARMLFRSYARADLPSGVMSHVVTTKFGDRFHADLSSYLEWQLWAFGAYEEHFAQLFTRLVRPGERCVDVGANVGIHTVRLARIVGETGRVLAVEADEDLARRADHNLRLNGLTNATVLHLAAAERGRRGAVLYRPERRDPNKGRASTLPHRYLSGPSAEVPTAALDDVVDGSVDLIKIDVEGGEPAVVRGAGRILADHHPAVLFEHSPELLGAGQSPVGTLLAHGYRLFDVQPGRHRMTGRTRVRLVPLVAPPARATNILALTSARVSRIGGLVRRPAAS